MIKLMMLNIKIEYENCKDDKHVDSMFEMAYYAVDSLVIDHMNFEVLICVDDIEETVNGMVFENMDDGNFLILIRERESLEDMILTIVHELVHVKQYLKDGLADCISEVNRIPYLEQWWEIEAFAETNKIVRKYVENKLERIF